jgi:regulatory protein
MADGRRRTRDPGADRGEPAAGRVAPLDGIDGGGAGRENVPIATLGELSGSAETPSRTVDGAVPTAGPQRSAIPGAGAPADFGQLGAGGRVPATPVADLAAMVRARTAREGGGQTGSGYADGGPGDRPGAAGGEAGPVALFDSPSLGAGREDVPVADVGPGALSRRAARGGRAGRRTVGETQRGRSRRRDVRAADAPGRELDGSGGSGRARDREGTGRSGDAPDRPNSVPERNADEQETRPRTQRGRGKEELDPDADPVTVAREICLRLLTERARTRRELAQALRRKGVPDEVAHSVLERFDEVGLIDDAAFAGQWVRSRHTRRGLARRAIAVELRRKGVSDEDAGEALAEVDAESEERRARELVDRKLRSLAVGTAEQRAAAGRRLVGMLARKGYGAGVAYRVVKEALAERGADADELGDAEVPED